MPEGWKAILERGFDLGWRVWEWRGGKFRDTYERGRLSELGREFRFLEIKGSEMAKKPEVLWRKCRLCRVTDNLCFLSFRKIRDFGF